MVKYLWMGALAALVACAAPKGTEKESQAATPVVEGESIELVAVPQQGGATINEALWKRCSSRDFTTDPLSLEELSGVLWAAAGVNRPENQHLTAPSALALYPTRTYAVLAGGVYYYNASAHRLERVVEGDYRNLSAMQEFAYGAPLNIVYIADRSVYAGKPFEQEAIVRLCALDAAGYAENANLYAAGHGLKAITRGSYKEAELLKLLGLDAERYHVALTQTIGK